MKNKMKYAAPVLCLLALMPLIVLMPSASASTYIYYHVARSRVYYSNSYGTYYLVWGEWARNPSESISFTPKYLIWKANKFPWSDYYFQCLLSNMGATPWSYLDPAAVAGYCCSSPACYFLVDLGILSS